MKRSVLSLTCAGGLAFLLGFGQLAFAGQQTTTRTGPNGNSRNTARIFEDGRQTTTRTGPNGNSRETTRTFEDGRQITTRTGPNDNSQETIRTFEASE